ncbi:MAG: DNA repair protein RadC [Elusimicrobiota bacterium]|jgi:DNA repair protein RadC|nr:DNA repair protein RadC [Elusimicrobiota bacterium]
MNKKSYNNGHRQRVKERFLQSGFANWQEYEILEFALFFALPQKDTKKIAKDLIEKFGSLKQVVDASLNELIASNLLGEHSAFLIKFLKNFSSLYLQLKIKSTNSITSSQEAVNFLSATLSGAKTESLYILILNSANKVTDCLEIESGTVNSSVVIPRKIAKIALEKNAVSVIMSHNHPGGNLKPSQSDIEATKNVKAALETVDILLLDHIIICNENYYSFKEHMMV